MKGGFNIKELLSQRSMELLEEADVAGQEEVSHKDQLKNVEVVMVDVYDLEPSRENFYQVDDSLKRSVELVGILQPLLVNRPEHGKYKVIAGHRRRLAVLSLVEEGNEERRYVPCVFKKEDVRDRLAIIMANRFRDKTDWERMMEAVEAEGLARELKKDYKLGGRTREVLAEITGLSEAQLGRYKAIFNHLDKGLMEDFRAGLISFSAVSELCGLPKEWQQEARRRLKENGALSLPEIKEWKMQKEERSQKRMEPSTDSGHGIGKAVSKEVIGENVAVGQRRDSQLPYRSEKSEEGSSSKNGCISRMPEIDKKELPDSQNNRNTRDIAAKIIEQFERFLQKYDITIPGPGDRGNELGNSARLYGTAYSKLLDEVENILKVLLERHTI